MASKRLRQNARGLPTAGLIGAEPSGFTEYSFSRKRPLSSLERPGAEDRATPSDASERLKRIARGNQAENQDDHEPSNSLSPDATHPAASIASASGVLLR